MKDMKTVLITGSRKGIGRYLSEHYLNEGYRVIGCSRDESDLQSANYSHFSVDVSNEKNVLNMFSSIRKEQGRLDILINNAGLTSLNHIMLTPMSSVEDSFRTNVFGTFLLCREGAKLMSKRKWGRIVSFSSPSVPLKTEGESVYAASKAAVNMLTQILAKELASMNITCNAIAPAPTETDMLSSFSEKAVNDIISAQAIKRMGQFSDISNAVDFFIQESSSFITGQVLYLGGVMN